MLIVTSVFWIIIVSGAVVLEKNSINIFDQFDSNVQNYTFWEFSGENSPLSKTNAKELVPQYKVIASFVASPVITVWLLALSIGWVKEGFNSKHGKG